MKLNKFTALPVLAAVALLAGCASGSGLIGNKATMNAGRPEIIDYAGQALGAEIPKWVTAAAEENYREVGKALGIDNSYKLFVVSDKGPNREFLESWVNDVSVLQTISDSMNITMARASEAYQKGSGESKDSAKATANTQRFMEQYNAALSVVTLANVAKESSYWIKTRTEKIASRSKSAKALNDSDYEEEFTYYVVYSIPMESYQKQMNAAIAHADDFTEESKALRDALMVRVAKQVESVSYHDGAALPTVGND